MFDRAMSTSSRPSTVNTNVMIVNESRPWMRAPISCTARTSQPALKFSTSRLVSKMPWPSSQSVSCRYNAWNRAALSMSQRPTVPKLQAIRPTSTVTTTSVTTSVASSATSAGILACSARCSGHTMAMTKSENATGARIERAK